MTIKILGDRNTIHQNLFCFLSVAFLVTIPFSLKISSILIGLLTLNWVAEWNWNAKLLEFRKHRLGFLLLGFYLLHVVGLLYSSNMNTGLFELEKKITFVLFPLILLSQPVTNRYLTTSVLLFFLAGVLLAGCFCLINAITLYTSTGDLDYFFYHTLSLPLGLHAIYFSYYVSFSIAILLIYGSDGWKIFTLYRKIVIIVLLVFFFILIFLLTSKALIVSTALIFMHFTYFVGLKAMSRSKKIATVLLIVITISVSVLSIPRLNQRFVEIVNNEIKQENVLFLDDYSGYHFSGGTIRLAIWKMIVNILHENNIWIIGVGTGDAQDVLTNEYIRRHVYPGDDTIGAVGFLDYNAHSYYFQVLITFGLVGLFYFGYLIYHLFRKSQSLKSLLLLYFIFLFAVFSLSESTLQVQKGIVFFTFISCWLVKSESRKFCNT